MHVFIATSLGQGQRRNDFCWTVEDELLGFPSFECATGSVDDHCGCRRSLSGLTSRRATTTALVIDQPELTVEGLTERIAASLQGGGWAKHMTAEELALAAQAEAAELARLAANFPAGTIVERRGNKMLARVLPGGDA